MDEKLVYVAQVFFFSFFSFFISLFFFFLFSFLFLFFFFSWIVFFDNLKKNGKQESLPHPVSRSERFRDGFALACGRREYMEDFVFNSRLFWWKVLFSFLFLFFSFSSFLFLFFFLFVVVFLFFGYAKNRFSRNEKRFRGVAKSFFLPPN